MATSAIRNGRKAHAVPWFGAVFVAACAAIIFFGFSFTFVRDVLSRARPVWLYLHIGAAVAWVLLVVVQATLAMRRKLSLHRRIGSYGFVLGAIAAVTAFIAALVLRHDSVVAHGASERAARIAFLAIPLNSALVFTALLAAAWGWRTRPAIHRRCMLLATAALTLPAFARMPGLGDLGPLLVVPTDVLIATLCAIDLWREGTIHRVYQIAVPAIVALQIASTVLLVAHPAWWVHTASILIGV
jgi:uncharacterized membrane protein YozB (DUF420 family)